ncbi:hypothetical protein DOJK_00342 [Patescibacteria group bacterium]|nr:hypothetical protein [Candidatus Dojkabacteria bacterium]CAG1020446.1 hypothetical protein DOJK_00342 [Patescibacteria group bacterium]
MDQEKSAQITSCLEDMTELLERLLTFSKDLLEQFSETGMLTVETKKDFDALVFECERTKKEAEVLLDAEEAPM